MGTLSGCLGIPQVETPIHQSSQGQVILRTFTDTSVKASHPSDIDLELLQRFLRGLRVLEHKELLAALVSGKGQELPAFTEKDIVFLAPILRDALMQATPDEFVWFQLENRAHSTPSFTSGALYLSGELLRFGLNEFQADRHSNKLSSKPSFSPTRVREWSLGFIPADANHQDSNASLVFPLPAPIGSVAIVLNALEHNKNSQPFSGQEKNPLQPRFKAQDHPTNRLQEMREEIGELQQQLEGQNRKLKQLGQELEQNK